MNDHRMNFPTGFRCISFLQIEFSCNLIFSGFSGSLIWVHFFPDAFSNFCTFIYSSISSFWISSISGVRWQTWKTFSMSISFDDRVVLGKHLQNFHSAFLYTDLKCMRQPFFITKSINYSLDFLGKFLASFLKFQIIVGWERSTFIDNFIFWSQKTTLTTW